MSRSLRSGAVMVYLRTSTVRAGLIRSRFLRSGLPARSSGGRPPGGRLRDAVDEAGELRAQRQVVHADRADLGDVVVALGPDHLRDGSLLREPGGGQPGDLSLAELRVALGDGEDQRDLGVQQA